MCILLLPNGTIISKQLRLLEAEGGGPSDVTQIGRDLCPTVGCDKLTDYLYRYVINLF